MDDSVFRSRLSEGVGGIEMWTLRKVTSQLTAEALLTVGVALSAHRAVGSDGDAVRAMGSLLRMAGELGAAAARMLSGKEHYAGAALLRQIVEIEYLTWTFKEQPE